MASLSDLNPILPAGYNSAPFNHDELNSAGYNWPIWPEYFGTFESLPGLILTDEMSGWFVNACPDVVIAKLDNTVVFTQEVRTLKMRKRAVA